MTWANAKADADRLTAAILERVAALAREHGQPTGPIRLAIYPTPHDFRYLRGSDPWSHEHHTAVVRAVARQLKRLGHKIALIDCTAEGCAAWLNERGLIGNTQHRAAYVASLTA